MTLSHCIHCPQIPMDCSPADSSVHRLLHARILRGLPSFPPGDLPDPGIKSGSPALQADSLPSEPQWTGCSKIILLGSNRKKGTVFSCRSSFPWNPSVDGSGRPGPPRPCVVCITALTEGSCTLVQTLVPNLLLVTLEGESLLTAWWYPWFSKPDLWYIPSGGVSAPLCPGSPLGGSVELGAGWGWGSLAPCLGSLKIVLSSLLNSTSNLECHTRHLLQSVIRARRDAAVPWTSSPPLIPLHSLFHMGPSTSVSKLCLNAQDGSGTSYLMRQPSLFD